MYKERYIRRKRELLNDNSINTKNREVIKKFLEYIEYKLKRKQGFSEVDERSYKTLVYYTFRLVNLNKWLNNKNWAELNKEEVQKLIDDLEDGIIKTTKGTRFTDRSLYYQMMKGKLFDLIGKSNYAIEIFKEFELKGRENPDEVRFIEEEAFRKIVECAISLEQKCLMWLAWDIGENIDSLLQLKRDDFKRQTDSETKEPEYLVVLSKDNLKRSRTPRSEITNYAETVKYLDMVLANIKPSTKIISNKFMKDKSFNELHNENKLFKFSMAYAQKFLRRAVEKSGVRCLPAGQKTSWKDLRSSMACDLLKKDWSRDEVNARLGHKPSSRIIDRYINYLALDRNKPKKKVYESNLKKIEEELEKQKEINKLQILRMDNLKESLMVEFKKEALKELKMELGLK
ncbi:MAG: tyrosine-type recombinase/integrase [Nanoarchaeota archaeon]|nr:tyrosine-type recombinase/integrase [Nanoarchaeota archaeon]